MNVTAGLRIHRDGWQLVVNLSENNNGYEGGTVVPPLLAPYMAYEIPCSYFTEYEVKHGFVLKLGGLEQFENVGEAFFSKELPQTLLYILKDFVVAQHALAYSSKVRSRLASPHVRITLIEGTKIKCDLEENATIISSVEQMIPRKGDKIALHLETENKETISYFLMLIDELKTVDEIVRRTKSENNDSSEHGGVDAMADASGSVIEDALLLFLDPREGDVKLEYMPASANGQITYASSIPGRFFSAVSIEHRLHKIMVPMSRYVRDVLMVIKQLKALSPRKLNIILHEETSMMYWSLEFSADLGIIVFSMPIRLYLQFPI